MICPKCGMYNTYGRPECTECGHSFVAKPIELSADETAAAQERENQPYYFSADSKEDEPRKPLLPPAVTETAEKVGGFFGSVGLFISYLWQLLKRHRRAYRVVLAVLALIVLALMIRCVSNVTACVKEQERQRALLASLADAVEEDPTPSVASMSDVWVLNQYETKLVINRDGTFTDGGADGGSGTWTHDIDKIYMIYDDGTLVNHTYQLLGDYLFLDWTEQVLERNCNESESVPAAGLWISGDGFAVALNEDGTHGAGSEEYGKYANTWVLEDGILATVTIIDNKEFFNYFGCQINGGTMRRIVGTVYVREGGGIALGGGEIEFSAGYDADS